MPQQRSWMVVGGSATALLLLAAISHHVVPGVDGHAYLMKPHSRQYLMSRVFKEEGTARFEDCPHCYNAGGPADTRDRAMKKTDPAVLAEYGEGFYPLRWVFDKGEMAPNGNYVEPEAIAVRHGVCGDPRQHQDESWNWYGTPNENWEVDYETTQGAVIQMKVAMSAYHWGHLEFSVCNTADLDDPKGGVVTQECFNKYPLTRAKGDDVNSPIDPEYPGRYYCDPECRERETDQEHDPRSDGGYIMTMNYQLPADLTCTHCVLQMTYYTGHKCRHPGYEEFNPPSWPGTCAPDKEDWVHLDVDYCGDDLWAYAEEFWGCSDFSISVDGSGPTPTDAPTTAAPTTAAPTTAAPTTEAPASTEDSPEETKSPSGPTEGVGGNTTAGAGGDNEGSEGECADPVEAYEQCGGNNFLGSTCCHAGHECTFMADCYYQCRPTKA